jgi:enoyl-CoA hydratase
VRIAADGAGRHGLTEIQVGVPFPASVLELMRYSTGGPHLPELLCQGRTYPPAEALVRRLVDEVVPPEALMTRATALAAEMGAFLSASFAATKAGLRRDALARMSAYPPGTDPVWAAWRSRPVLEAVAAYRAKTLSAKKG